MRCVLAAQPRDQVGFHRYDPAQFGLETDEMAAHFTNYCDRFDTPHAGSGGVRTRAAPPR